MPTLTITTTGPLKANVDIGGNTIREPIVTDHGDGLVEVELGGAGVSAVLVGRPDTISQLLAEALATLEGLRDR